MVDLQRKLIEHHSSSMMARDHRCPGCFGCGTTVKRDTFFRLPEVLTIRIKRESYDTRSQTSRKIDSPVDFPDVLSLSECLLYPERPIDYNGDPCSSSYRLYAACFHDGLDTSSGHYTASVRTTAGDAWVGIDDRQIEYAESPREIERQTSTMPPRASMLFYRRLTMDETAALETAAPESEAEEEPEAEPEAAEAAPLTTDIFGDEILHEPTGAHECKFGVRNLTPWELQIFFIKVPQCACEDQGPENWKLHGQIAAGKIHSFGKSFNGHVFGFAFPARGGKLGQAECRIVLGVEASQWYSVSLHEAEAAAAAEAAAVAAPIAIDIAVHLSRPVDWPAQAPSGTGGAGGRRSVEVQLGDAVRIWSISRGAWVRATVISRSGNDVQVRYVYEPDCGKWVDCTDPSVLVFDAEACEEPRIPGTDPSLVQRLVDMGFEAEAASTMLEGTNGNVEEAIAILTSL